MFGSIVYIILDVSFNVLLWSGKKTIDGVINISKYAYNKLEKNDELLQIEPPPYNNVLKEIEMENEKIDNENKRENIIKINELKLLMEEQENTMKKIKKIIN